MQVGKAKQANAELETALGSHREAAGQQCLFLRTTDAWFICEFVSTHSSLPGATQPAVRSVIFFVLLTACDLSLVNIIYCTTGPLGAQKE